MNDFENDTLFVESEQQNNVQPQPANKAGRQHIMAKVLAAGGAGMLLGGGATYAATELLKEDTPLSNHDDDRLQNTDTTLDNTSDDENQNGENDVTDQPSVEERLAALEAQEQQRQQQEHYRQSQEHQRQINEHQRQINARQREEEIEHPDEPKEHGFMDEHEVVIVKIGDYTDDETGMTARVALGMVDGHDAVFVADENGKFSEALVDWNDDEEIDENHEVVDLSGDNIREQQLVACKIDIPVEEDDPIIRASDEVEVVEVYEDVEMNGHVVDVAQVKVNDETVALVDVDQDKIVDVAIRDDNHDGNLTENEFHDVSQQGWVMPSNDDVPDATMVSLDDPDNDYNNNADIEMYEA